MPRTLTFGTICLAFAVAAPLAPGQAEEQDNLHNAITIVAPRTEEYKDPLSVAKIRQLTASSVIYTDDLDLSTDQGRQHLQKRVETAATETCRWLDDIYPNDHPQQGEAACIHNAIDSAHPQVLAVLASAG